MRLTLSPKNFLTPVLLSLLVAGCGGKLFDVLDLSQRARMEKAYKKADAMVLKDEAAEAAAHLWTIAPRLPPPHRQDMQVRAADILLDADRPLDAYRYLLEISEQAIAGVSLLKKRVAEARFYDQTDQPEKVLAVLPAELIEQGDAPTKIAALELSADALLLGDEFVRGIKAHLELHELLDEEQRPANIATLWQALLYLDPRRVEEALSRGRDGRVRPWLELAALATPLEMQRERLEQEYAAWERKNRRWPLPDSIAEALRVRWEYLDYRPQRVALLLPLTGSYAKAGKAVKDGFFEAYERAATPEFTVAIHNTDQSDDITAVYAKAVEDQAVDLVIGPLLKSEIDALVAQGDMPVPTISLNYASADTYAPPSNLFQFGLLPENEALQAAHKMWGDGHEFVAVLAPDDKWGERLYRAFVAEYTGLGGKVQAVSRYDPSFVDYAITIESLFQLDQSRERHRLVAATLGDKPRFKPRIRDDITAAMLFADHHRAVLIFPQMKFHYVDKLPTYATSHIYNPTTLRSGRDLDGLIYCDIPAIIQRAAFTDTEADEYARLFALGADAQQLINRFRYMEIARFAFNGQTGKISIEANRRLFRELPWARFSRGKPVPFDIL